VYLSVFFLAQVRPKCDDVIHYLFFGVVASPLEMPESGNDTIDELN
jgi:hypothetical protein